ncbi:hypothetical protein VTK26DRAFT_1592 [Humicola hyalothermophila]
MPPRIPTQADFAPLLDTHPSSSSSYSASSTSSTSSHPSSRPPPISLVYPSPPESTTAILLLFHGFGDSERPFAGFARNLSLPGVLGIAVRGVAPLPAVGLTATATMSEEKEGWHWGDDLRFVGGGGGDGEGREGRLDEDPGFERARGWVMERVVGEVLVGKCGWELSDIMLFGFGQGGSLALGLASGLRLQRVELMTEGSGGGRGMGAKKAFKGVVSMGGPLPASMVPSVSGLGKAKTPVLVCCGRESEAVDEDAVDFLEKEFENVKVVRWKRASDGMPQNRDEALPMMQFFAERLRNGWL